MAHDGFRYAARLHGHIQTNIFRHFESDTPALYFLEARRFDNHLVRTRRQAGCNEITRVIGLQCSRNSRVHIGDGHVRAFDEAATLVGHSA